MSLSSIEAEYYGAVSASGQGLCTQAVIQFMASAPVRLIVLLDNAAARQFSLRQGVSRSSKHIEGRLLWLQDAVRAGRLELHSVSTDFNLRDLYTKPFTPARLLTLVFLHDFVDIYNNPIGGIHGMKH